MTEHRVPEQRKKGRRHGRRSARGNHDKLPLRSTHSSHSVQPDGRTTDADVMDTPYFSRRSQCKCGNRFNSRRRKISRVSMRREDKRSGRKTLSDRRNAKGRCNCGADAKSKLPPWLDRISRASLRESSGHPRQEKPVRPSGPLKVGRFLETFIGSGGGGGLLHSFAFHCHLPFPSFH